MPQTVYLQISQTGLSTTSLLITDIGFQPSIGSNGFAKPKPVYIPTTGNVDLIYTSDVALSYESGVIRSFINTGYLVVTFKVSEEFATAVHKWKGWADYNGSGAPQTVPAGVWTKLTNDGLGPLTNTQFLPPNITSLFDTASSTFDFTELDIGNPVSIRMDWIATPTINNTAISVRLYFPSSGTWSLLKRIQHMDDGAGVDYPFIEAIPFYIGSLETQAGGAWVQVHVGSETDIVVNGFFIEIF